MQITTDSYAPVFAAFAGVFAMAIALLVMHGIVTSHAVPEDLLTDCVGAQVLDPVTHTCGGQ